MFRLSSFLSPIVFLLFRAFFNDRILSLFTLPSMAVWLLTLLLSLLMAVLARLVGVSISISRSAAYPMCSSSDHDLSVDVIHNSDYNALEQCFFAIEDQAKLTSKVSTKDGSQHILDNSPRMIIAVDCTGSCVPMYGKYARSNSRDPAYLTTVNGRRVL